MRGRALKVFFVVGEESGDLLGAGLLSALRERLGGAVEATGIAGTRMQRLGMTSLFPLHDIAVMGLTAVLARLPTIVARVHQTVAAAVAADPDVVVVIDSPDFTHAVAKRLRKRRPDIPIVDYVSPSVWAWRPGRARKMAAYVDHLLAILPFEPAVHRRLGGPPCTYVGHPLLERIAEASQGPRDAPDEPPTLLVLPGSRRSETSRMLGPLGATLAALAAAGHRFRAVLPTVPHLEAEVRAAVAGWPVRPEVIVGEGEKFAAFSKATAALAASGTVTLELALSGVPMVVGYRLDWFYRRLKDLARRIPGIALVDTMVLTNLILEEKVVPEFLDEEVAPDHLLPVLAPLLDRDSPEHRRQTDAFRRLRGIMALPGGDSPGDIAARVVVEVARQGRAAG